MNAIPDQIIVIDTTCSACGVDAINVYHQHFPELRTGGCSTTEAAQRLADQLESSLDAVDDPSKRQRAQQAIADARAFAASQSAPSAAPKM